MEDDTARIRFVGPRSQVALCPAWALALLIGLCLGLAGAAEAQPAAERRVALVVGVGAYLNAPQLANPVHDARAMAETCGG